MENFWRSFLNLKILPRIVNVSSRVSAKTQFLSTYFGGVTVLRCYGVVGGGEGVGHPQTKTTCYVSKQAEKPVLIQRLNKLLCCCKIMTLDAVTTMGNNAVCIPVLSGDDTSGRGCFVCVTIVTVD